MNLRLGLFILLGLLALPPALRAEAPIAGAPCRAFQWWDLAYSDIEKRESGLETKIRVFSDIESPEPKEVFLQALADLRRSGGDGRFVENITSAEIDGKPVTEKFTVIEVTKIPERNFGAWFKEIASELKEAKIPIFLDPLYGNKGYAHVWVAKRYTKEAFGYAIFPSQLSKQMSLIQSHERAHIRDAVSHYLQFSNELPPIPRSLSRSLEKLKSGEEISWLSQKRLNHVEDYLRALSEVRADQSVFRDLLNPKNFYELINSDSLPREVAAFIYIVRHWFRHQSKLRYHSIWVNPLHPSTYLLTAKTAAGSTMVLAVTMGARGIFYLLDFLGKEEEKAP